jgi:hypothetical protein
MTCYVINQCFRRHCYSDTSLHLVFLFEVFIYHMFFISKHLGWITSLLTSKLLFRAICYNICNSSLKYYQLIPYEQKPAIYMYTQAFVMDTHLTQIGWRVNFTTGFLLGLEFYSRYLSAFSSRDLEAVLVHCRKMKENHMDSLLHSMCLFYTQYLTFLHRSILCAFSILNICSNAPMTENRLHGCSKILIKILSQELESFDKLNVTCSKIQTLSLRFSRKIARLVGVI